MNPRTLFTPLLLMMSLSVIACDAGDGSARPRSKSPAESMTQPTGNMKINLKLRDKTLTATLYDTRTARDFASMLPLTLTLEDYASAEKISYLPRKLTTEGAPAGTGGPAGAVAYYAPWGNLALFYKDFRPADGLIVIGKLNGGVEMLSVAGSVKVKIELQGERP